MSLQCLSIWAPGVRYVCYQDHYCPSLMVYTWQQQITKMIVSLCNIINTLTFYFIHNNLI